MLHTTEKVLLHGHMHKVVNVTGLHVINDSVAQDIFQWIECLQNANVLNILKVVLLNTKFVTFRRISKDNTDFTWHIITVAPLQVKP